MATLRESQILPQVTRVLCIWLPKESHRYSRRLPAFYVLPIVGQWSTGSPSPSICRTAPTCLPLLIQTWVTVPLAVLLISVSQGTTASLPCISNATSWSFWELCISRSPALSRSFPDQHHAFWARTVSRLTAGRALPCLIRERQHWPGRVSGCHSGAHGLPGHLILHEQAPSDTNGPCHYV